MLENICNEDMLVSFENSAGPPDIEYLGDQGIDTVKVVPTLANSCKLSGKKVATQKVQVTWVAPQCAYVSAGAFTFVSGAAVLFASAQKTRANGQAVLLEGDTSDVGCIGSWTNNSTGATVSCACAMEIASAGQDRGKGS